MKVYILQPDPYDSAIDSVFVDAALAARRADALGIEIDEVEISESLPAEMLDGLSFYQATLFRDGTVWHKPRKTTHQVEVGHHVSEGPDGVLGVWVWARDEADALERAQAELKRLVESGTWICNAPHPSWWRPRMAREEGS